MSDLRVNLELYVGRLCVRLMKAKIELRIVNGVDFVSISGSFDGRGFTRNIYAVDLLSGDDWLARAETDAKLFMEKLVVKSRGKR